MPTLEVRGLKKSIDGHGVLKDVSFGLQDGELAAILGPSGGGKTTLFRCILGELTPEAGEIFIDGQEVGQLPTERRGIGVVYQSFALFPHLSVADNIGYGLRARRGPAGSTETMMKHSDPFIQDFMKMVLFADAIVQMGPDGAPYITLDGGAKIPVHIPDVRGGEKVHVMVKKGAEAERIEVWQRDAK